MKTTRLLIILLISILSLGMVTGSLAAANLTNRMDAPGAAATPEISSNRENNMLLVVRAYYTDRQMVNDLAKWIEPWEVNHDQGYLVVGVYPHQYELLEIAGFRLEIDEQLTALYNQPLTYLPGQTDGIPGYPCYRTVEETFTSAQDLASSHPQLAAWIDIGDSWEKVQPGGLDGYNLMVLRLTNAAIPGPKPKLFLMTSVHAREYTPAELNTRFGEYLVNNYNIDADVTWLLDHHEIHLLLQANPDGRKHAENGLSWRKNTNENYCSPTSTNRGADLNRNFEFKWGCCGGSSGYECDELYRGPSAGSEPEVQAIQSYVRSQFPDLRDDPLTSTVPLTATGVFLDIHSYGELVIWPWGFTHQEAPNGTELQTLGRKLAYFNDYHPDQAIGLYPTDGTTDDFAYGDLGLAAYTFELGTTFFQSCSTFENVILPDNLPALLYAAKTVRTPYITPGGPEALALAATPPNVISGQPIQLSATINDTRFNNSNGAEPTQNIAGAEYYIDTPPWSISGAPIPHPMTALDGSFDEKAEEVIGSIDTSGLSSGRHTVFLRGKDALGNWGPFSAIFIHTAHPSIAPTVEGYVRQAGSHVPLEATISAGFFQTTSDPATGFYSMQVFSNTYDITTSASDHVSQEIQEVNVPGGEITQQDFSLTPYCPVFSDDVENENVGWIADTPWAIVDSDASSPSHAWTDSPDGDYANGTDSALTSPLLNLTGYQYVKLTFWQRFEFQEAADFGHIDYSVDGGYTWTTATSFHGDSSGWVKESILLPALDDLSNVRIRFRISSDASGTGDGWTIDDITISGGSTLCVVPRSPSANFTNESPASFGQPVQFINRSTGSLPMTYTWDFGVNTATSTLAFPTYTYDTSGVYTVTLTATNPSGSNSTQRLIDVQPCVEIQDVELLQVGYGISSPGDALNFLIDISPEDAHKPFNFTIDYGDGNTITESAKNDPLSLSHSYPFAGAYTAEVAVWNCGLSTPLTDTLQVDVNIVFGLSLAPSSDEKTAVPDSMAIYTLQLTNTGNTTDTFRITTNSLWESSIFTPEGLIPKDGNLVLAAGDQFTLTVAVTVPADATPGAADTAVLKIGSLGDPSQTKEARLTTRALAYKLFMPWVSQD